MAVGGKPRFAETPRPELFNSKVVVCGIAKALTFVDFQGGERGEGTRVPGSVQPWIAFRRFMRFGLSGTRILFDFVMFEV